jgi:hypothetical protein
MEDLDEAAASDRSQTSGWGAVLSRFAARENDVPVEPTTGGGATMAYGGYTKLTQEWGDDRAADLASV